MGYNERLNFMGKDKLAKDPKFLLFKASGRMNIVIDFYAQVECDDRKFLIVLKILKCTF